MPHMLSVDVKFSISRAFVFTFLLAQSAAAATIEISIPYGSQAIGRSRPSDDQTWDVTAQNGTFNDTLGIGIIIDPTYPI